ncbi:putative 24-dienoyl-CoA reductase-like protein [Naja naja]|nr:putative 24-dienoyl-CoA reductase-like protein [Naja naja]
MAHAGFACEPPPDVDTDDCLPEYSYIFQPDILKGKVAFVTGGGSGIGFRIAEILMRHGCQCVIASRKLERLTEAAKKLSAATGQRCLPVSLDVRQPQSISAAVDEALREFEKIDILVNNAAGNFLCPASSLSFNGYKTENGGVIVNITATLSYKGLALQMHAGTAKAAIDAMTKHLAVEWGPQRIRVISVAPGPISGTEGYRRLVPPNLESNHYFQNIPLQRVGNKTEIAHSVLYLVSPLASYVTGTTLVVDGGDWMTSENSFPSLLGIAKL